MFFKNKEIRKLTKAAKSGDAQAQYELASAYYFGKNVEKDYDKAEEWAKKAHAANVKDAGLLLEWISSSRDIDSW